MSSNHAEDPKPDGKAFDDFFDSIGNKAQNLTTNGTDEKPTANGDGTVAEPEEEQKVVDEIESLCMNCRENVCQPHVTFIALY